MKALLLRIDDLSKRRGRRWTREGNTIRVSLHEGGRTQRVHVSRDENRYVFRSVVLPASEVTRNDDALAPHRLSSMASECLQGTGDVRIR